MLPFPSFAFARAAGIGFTRALPLYNARARLFEGLSNEFRRLTRTGAQSTEQQRKQLYLAEITIQGQVSPAILGILHYTEKLIPRVGFFNPITGDVTKSGLDKHVDLVSQTLGLKGDPFRSQCVSVPEAAKLIADGKSDELLDKLYEAYANYAADKDFVLIEGCGESIGGTDLDAQVASAFGAPVVMHITGKPGMNANEYYNLAMVKRDVFVRHKANVVGILINRVSKADHALLTESLKEKFAKSGLAFAGAIPEDELLASLRLDDMMTSFNAQLMYGRQSFADQVFRGVVIGSQTLEDLLQTLYAESGMAQPLVVTTRDRVDLIMGLVMASMSNNAPSMAGMLLTASGTHMEADGISHEADRVLHGLDSGGSRLPLPIFSVDLPLYEAVQKVGKLQPEVLPTSQTKISQTKILFERYIDMEEIGRGIVQQEAVMSPKMFTNNIKTRCRNSPQHIVLPEGWEPRVIAAAANVTQRGLAKVTLLGDPAKVQAEAKKMGVDVSGCEIRDFKNDPNIDSYVQLIMQARKKKEVPMKVYEDMMKTDVNLFGVLMVMAGHADGMVSGAVHTTAETIRPALWCLREHESSLASSVFFMCLPDKVLVYGDCAVNPSPNSQELAQIAITSADTAAAFGITPRVALLSYSTLGSGAGPDVKKVVEAVALVKQRRPELAVEGPIQYDAAIDPTVAKVKVKTPSEVAGKANVFIFPDLNTGNNTYKAVQQATGAIAMGPVMQGLLKPVNDLSRGCTVADIVNTICVTSVQAMQAKGRAAAAASS